MRDEIYDILDKVREIVHKQQFTQSDVHTITNNLEKVIYITNAIFDRQDAKCYECGNVIKHGEPAFRAPTVGNELFCCTKCVLEYEGYTELIHGVTSSEDVK